MTGCLTVRRQRAPVQRRWRPEKWSGQVMPGKVSPGTENARRRCNLPPPGSSQSPCRLLRAGPRPIARLGALVAAWTPHESDGDMASQRLSRSLARSPARRPAHNKEVVRRGPDTGRRGHQERDPHRGPPQEQSHLTADVQPWVNGHAVAGLSVCARGWWAGCVLWRRPGLRQRSGTRGSQTVTEAPNAHSMIMWDSHHPPAGSTNVACTEPPPATKYGCRCQVCRRANTDAMRAANARRRAALPVTSPTLKHGTTGTCSNHGCRCDACTEAVREANRNRPSRSQRRDS